MLNACGAGGIIAFRSILLDLIHKVEVNRSYRKSDTLEVLRILKNYDLLRDPQMDFLPPRPFRLGKIAFFNCSRSLRFFAFSRSRSIFWQAGGFR